MRSKMIILNSARHVGVRPLAFKNWYTVQRKGASVQIYSYIQDMIV